MTLQTNIFLVVPTILANLPILFLEIKGGRMVSLVQIGIKQEVDRFALIVTIWSYC